MKYFKKIILIMIPLILLTGCGKEELNETDALKFKREYEALNDTKRESDGANYNNVTIPEDNPIVYVDCEKALEVLDQEKAILYVGAEWCPWCRNAIPVLFEVAKEYNIDKIYYLNLDNEKSNYEIQDGKLVKINSGTDNYYKLLDRLSDNLRDYVLTDENKKKYDTGEKRIYMPYVIGIKNKTIVSDHVGTVSLEDNQTKYSNLTEKQHDELYKIYENMFKGVFGNSSQACGTDECN